MSASTCGRLTKWTVGAVLLQVLGLYLFVLGFFPVKPTLSGVRYLRYLISDLMQITLRNSTPPFYFRDVFRFSGPESYRIPSCDSPVGDGDPTPLPPDQLRSLFEGMSEIPPSFDRLILMVIDGLPAEFVLGKGDQSPNKALMDAMPYTQSLLSDGRAVGYHARAAPPTVTMPRLKAMVSGSIGGFLDVAFNFNTQAFLDDNLLDLLYKVGWRMVMLGDETWVKLFPGLFIREDGVKDTVEVDHNVSRHLDHELVNDDWNLLLNGFTVWSISPFFISTDTVVTNFSALMPPKLKEMDEVIEKIHMSMILDEKNLDKHTLLVDIAPTLALLYGVPIPKNNIGVLIARVLGSLTDEQWLRALELNSWQVLRLLQAQKWHLDESFVCTAVVIHVLSLGASSMIVSVFLVISFGFFALFLVKSMKTAIRVIQMGLCFTVLLILYHIIESESHAVISTNSLVQAIYMMVGVIAIGTALLSPWIVPLPYLNIDRNMEPSPDLLPIDMNIESLLVGIRDSAYLFATMYFLGMGGHFSLGNSNTLATIDLAGAFMGISSHSTVLAGILVFMITYASPMLFLLAMTMYIPTMGMKCLAASRSENLGLYLQMTIGVPCILPLGLNSIVLTAFTIILLLMRNHLFVWSVFSPNLPTASGSGTQNHDSHLYNYKLKDQLAPHILGLRIIPQTLNILAMYLYVCAATVSMYVGVSVIASVRIYVYSVIFFRARMFNSRQGSLAATKME
ncbi:hypothetical protein ACLOJK_016457 [Asimina triloba]